MFKTKTFAAILLIVTVLFAQVGTALAAPNTEVATPISGTIQSITLQTDANGVTTVVVTLLDSQGVTQTVNLTVEEALNLGLVTLDPVTNEPVVDETKIGTTIEITPTTEEEPVNPVAGILASFFGVDAATINQYHEDGFGFGVIAQALWIAQGLNGDVSTAGLILEAKKTGDYSAFVLPDGSTPTNWGQFKKAALGKDKKNLGIIVSGHATNDGTDETTTQTEHGKGKNNGKGNGNGNKP